MLTRIRSWFSPNRQPTLADIVGRMGIAATTGEIISPRTILGHPAVWRGVDLLSTSVARIPFDVFKRLPDGSRDQATEHPAQRLLKHKPNRYYHRFQLLKSWMVSALTHGDGYIYVTRDDLGRPLELLLLDSGSTGIIIEDGELLYTTTQNGRLQKIQAENILHLRGLGTDGISGLPIYQVLAEAFGLGLTLQRYQNVFFKNAGKPSVVIKLPPEISTREQVQEFREAWNNVHGGGIDNAFRPALLRPGAEITTLQADGAITSLANLREHDLVMVSNILGLPPHRLGARSVSVSYGSLEQENRSFLEDLDGWLCQIECELMKLLKSSEIDTHYIEANRDARVAIDAKTKAELLGIYRRNGLMSDEELRKKLNLPISMEGTFWTEANLMTREKALADPIPVELPKETVSDSPESPQNDAETLGRDLTRSIVGRVLRRLEKSGRIDHDLLKQELGNLPGYDRFAEALPMEELAAVLPEQRKNIIDNMDINQLTEELWKS